MILCITACGDNGAKWTPTFGDSNADKDKWINWSNDGNDYGTLVSTVNGRADEIRVSPGSSEKIMIKWETDGFILIQDGGETRVKNDQGMYFGYNIDLYDTSLSRFWIETESGEKIYEIKVK